MKKSVKPKARGFKNSGGAPTKALCNAIRSGFSDDEIPELLAHLLKTLDEPAVQRFAESLGPERGQTLRDVLTAGRAAKGAATSGKVKPDAPLGPGRARQDWEKAWSDWDVVISESNDEHGEYLHQEHHWEPPYFCPGDVAEALEPIAARMRPLISKLVAAGYEPDFSFLETMKESLDETAAGLEDWMGAWEGDGMGYGPQVTTCLFEAEWAWTRKRNGSLSEVVENIQEFELTNKKASLDSRAAAAFLLALPREELVGIAKDLARGPAEKRSRWWQDVSARVQPKSNARSKSDRSPTRGVRR